MSRVKNLVEEIRAEAKTPKTITQTVRIPELSYHRLRVLAPLLELPYGNLASRLLVAAIDDAIDTLPEEERTWGPNYPQKMSARDYVLEAARDNWIGATMHEEIQPTLATMGEKLRRGKRRLETESEDEAL